MWHPRFRYIRESVAGVGALLAFVLSLNAESGEIVRLGDRVTGQERLSELSVSLSAGEIEEIPDPAALLRALRTPASAALSEEPAFWAGSRSTASRASLVPLPPPTAAAFADLSSSGTELEVSPRVMGAGGPVGKAMEATPISEPAPVAAGIVVLLQGVLWIRRHFAVQPPQASVET